MGDKLYNQLLTYDDNFNLLSYLEYKGDELIYWEEYKYHKNNKIKSILAPDGYYREYDIFGTIKNE